MAIYTLRENEKELFVLRADSIKFGASNSVNGFFSELRRSMRDSLRRLPLIGCCCGSRSVDVVVTDQRIIIADYDNCLWCNTDITVTSLSRKILDGYNSYTYMKSIPLFGLCCLCTQHLYSFSIGNPPGYVFSYKTVFLFYAVRARKSIQS